MARSLHTADFRKRYTNATRTHSAQRHNGMVVSEVPRAKWFAGQLHETSQWPGCGYTTEHQQQQRDVRLWTRMQCSDASKLESIPGQHGCPGTPHAWQIPSKQTWSFLQALSFSPSLPTVGVNMVASLCHIQCRIEDAMLKHTSF
jgi:hypothetical protein